MTIVFSVSDNIKEKMIEFYQDKRRSKTPPYAVFQADDADTNITLYESGKVVFQGNNADIDANIWKDMEKSFNNRDIDAEIKQKEDKKAEKKEDAKDLRFINVATIGSDEVGTGDYFGPVVVTASYVDKEHMSLMYELGVKDSKKLTDQKILEIGPTLIKKIPHSTFILDNKTYNQRPTNMNQIKAVLHNKVLCEMVKKGYDYKYVVVKNGKKVNELKFEFEQEKEEISIKLTETNNNEKKSYKFKCIEENNIKYIKIEVREGTSKKIIKVRMIYDTEKNQYSYDYKYVKEK